MYKDTPNRYSNIIKNLFNRNEELESESGSSLNPSEVLLLRRSARLEQIDKLEHIDSFASKNRLYTINSADVCDNTDIIKKHCDSKDETCIEKTLRKCRTFRKNFLGFGGKTKKRRTIIQNQNSLKKFVNLRVE